MLLRLRGEIWNEKVVLTHELCHSFTSYAIIQRGKNKYNGRSTDVFICEGFVEYFVEISFSEMKLELEKYRRILGMPDY